MRGGCHLLIFWWHPSLQCLHHGTIHEPPADLQMPLHRDPQRWVDFKLGTYLFNTLIKAARSEGPYPPRALPAFIPHSLPKEILVLSKYHHTRNPQGPGLHHSWSTGTGGSLVRKALWALSPGTLLTQPHESHGIMTALPPELKWFLSRWKAVDPSAPPPYLKTTTVLPHRSGTTCGRW